MGRFVLLLFLLIGSSAGCAEPNGYAALPLAGNQVYESHGYSNGSQLDFVLIEIYSNPQTAAQMSEERVKDDVLVISLDVGDQQIENIRGNEKLYIIHDDELTIYDLHCDEGDVSDVVGSIPGFKSAEQFKAYCVKTLTSTDGGA